MAFNNATPLPDHVVNLTLEYLLPPGSAIPPHLLSKALLQRHHFLDINPLDPASYLCWPGAPNGATDNVIRALELQAGNPDLLEKRGHEVVYDADDESIRARVRVGDEVQVIFTFDNPMDDDGGGWRYHDAKPLPFPASATPSFEAVMDTHASDDPHIQVEQASTGASTPTSDAYWDNYGASSSQSPQIPQAPLPDPKLSAEDAYWASYSQVQGTADSTIPSPMVPARLARRGQTSHSHIPSQDHQPNGFIASESSSPPSPPYRPYADDEAEGVYEDGSFPSERVMRQWVPEEETHAEKLTRALMQVEPPQTPGLASYNEPLKSEDLSHFGFKAVAADGALPMNAEKGSSDSDAFVAESVRGLYKLWAVRGISDPMSEGEAQRKARFLELVSKALA